MNEELKAMPNALRLIADQITAPDHVPAMCLRDAAAMIESLEWQLNTLRNAGGLMRDWIGNNEKTITERWDSALANVAVRDAEDRH